MIIQAPEVGEGVSDASLVAEDEGHNPLLPREHGSFAAFFKPRSLEGAAPVVYSADDLKAIGSALAEGDDSSETPSPPGGGFTGSFK